MNAVLAETRSDNREARNPFRQVLFRTAVISTGFGCLYLLGLTGKWIVDGSIHSPSSPSVRGISAAIGLLWDITLLIMFVALRRLMASRNPVFAELGLVFMGLVCATSSINWFVQLTLVPRLVIFVDDFPRSFIGKVLRRELARRYEASRAAQDAIQGAAHGE